MSKMTMKDLVKSYDGEYNAVNKVNLEVNDKEFCVLLGPSGCGKTTLLRMIAGLESITDGDLFIDGDHMNNVLPKDRDIAMVFQSYALYPHMTVYKNMAFGLKMKKIPATEIDTRIKKAAKALNLEEYLERKPRNLSGGQQQRVALGRALVKNPKVFLMDEPLSNLDAKLRNQTRENIVNIHKEANATTVYVTHDQVEAMTMGDKIVVMNKGSIQQIGSPDEIYSNPANMFVAGFIGSPAINFIEGVIDNGHFISDGFNLKITEQMMPKLESYNGKTVTIGIRPEFLHTEVDNIYSEMTEAKVKLQANFLERLGSDYLVHGYINDQRTTAKIRFSKTISRGEVLDLCVDMNNVYFFDKESKLAIN